MGPFPTLASTLMRFLRARSRRKYASPRLDQPSRVEWATGCCLLVRRQCLKQLGGLDEEFFLYYEDVDLCRRAQSQGWSVRFEPALRVTHHRPLHGRPLSARLRVFTRHALLVYSSKHWPRWQFRVLAGIVVGEAWCRRCWALVRGQCDQADQFRKLGAIARQLVRGRHSAARRCLERVVRTPKRFLHRNSCQT